MSEPPYVCRSFFVGTGGRCWKLGDCEVEEELFARSFLFLLSLYTDLTFLELFCLPKTVFEVFGGPKYRCVYIYI